MASHLSNQVLAAAGRASLSTALEPQISVHQELHSLLCMHTS